MSENGKLPDWLKELDDFSNSVVVEAQRAIEESIKLISADTPEERKKIEVAYASMWNALTMIRTVGTHIASAALILHEERAHGGPGLSAYRERIQFAVEEPPSRDPRLVPTIPQR